jgi:hypothetical protein
MVGFRVRHSLDYSILNGTARGALLEKKQILKLTHHRQSSRTKPQRHQFTHGKIADHFHSRLKHRPTQCSNKVFSFSFQHHSKLQSDFRFTLAFFPAQLFHLIFIYSK